MQFETATKLLHLFGAALMIYTTWMNGTLSPNTTTLLHQETKEKGGQPKGSNVLETGFFLLIFAWETFFSLFR
jgi:hypothetical protein